jgi:3-hydroxy-9,10-secoandrosta-1,3,5(10)-triene-9,17-dione monooxygenase reductase component
MALHVSELDIGRPGRRGERNRRSLPTLALDHPGPGIDSGHFKSVMGQFATGVAVVAATDGPDPVGFTCQSFVSVSLQPPLVAFAAAKTSLSWPRVARGGLFCVSVLGRDQHGACRALAVSGPDKFSSVKWQPSPRGLPIVEGAVAWVECAIDAVHDAGDHDLVVGAVLDLDWREGEPLVYHRGELGGFAGS